MTRYPFESWNIVARPDLPAYELNAACPVTGEVSGLENHHIVRRSFGPAFRDAWWTELDDGTVVGNHINLSGSAHHLVTIGKCSIIWHPATKDFWWYDWRGEQPTQERLRWQPPIWLEDGVEYAEAQQLAQEGKAYWLKLQTGMDDKVIVTHTHEAVQELEVPEGAVCPTCERRKPHKKKASSPKSKVFSTRIPLDDVETFNEIVDAAAEHHGLKAKPHHVYWTLLYAVTLLLQQEKGELPV